MAPEFLADPPVLSVLTHAAANFGSLESPLSPPRIPTCAALANRSRSTALVGALATACNKRSGPSYPRRGAPRDRSNTCDLVYLHSSYHLAAENKSISCTFLFGYARWIHCFKNDRSIFCSSANEIPRNRTTSCTVCLCFKTGGIDLEQNKLR